MRRIILFIPLIYVGLNLSFSQSGIPFIYNYSSDEYEAGIQNWDVTQDETGRIYVANNFGLLVYDGEAWQLMNTANGTKLRSVLAYDNKIYAGYQKDFGFYSPNSKGELVYTSLADSLQKDSRDFDEIWKIYSLGNSIYFAGLDFIFKYEDNELTTIKPDQKLELSFLVQEQLWVQESEKGLTRLREGLFEPLENGDSFKSKRVSGIIPIDKNQQLIATFNQGLFIYSDGVFKPYSIELFPSQNLIINSIHRLSNGLIALGTQNNGLVIIDKNGHTVNHLTKFKGLIDNTVNAIFEDKEGNLWLSMNNGISRVAINAPFSIIDYRMGVNGAGYSAYYDTEKGLYLGTNNGLFLYKNDGFELIKGTEGQVYSIQKLNGHLFVGHNNGPIEIIDDKAKLLSEVNGAWLFREIPNKENQFIIGTYQGLSKLTYENGQAIVKKLPGFDESSRVMQFSNKELWVTQGYKGAYKIEFDADYSKITNLELYNSNKGFPTDNLINVFDVGNRLIFGSESGVFSYNEEQDAFERIEAYDKALGGDISLVDIDTDELNNQYYIATEQIGRLSSRTGAEFIHKSSTFNPILNQWNNDLGNIQVINSGNILIGAREGFIQYIPELDIPSTQNYSIHFNEILLNKNDSVLYAGFGDIQQNNIVLPYPSNDLSFEFAAPHFSSDKQIEYAYRLSGYEEEWSEYTTENKVVFTNLYEGNYSLEVKAKNIYEQESEITRFNFEIKPPFYRSYAAYVFYFSGTLALLFLAFKLLDRRFKKEKAVILDTKNKMIQEKDEELKTVSEKSESEIIKLRNDKLQTELKLKNQALTSSAMNLIQKNQLLNQIKNTLNSFSEEAGDSSSKSKIQKIVKSINRDLSSSDEWQQFKENFDQVHGQFITRLKQAYPDLTPQEIKFSAYLRMNLNTKEIANLLNISVRGVEIGRYRVRKKLGLERKDNLSDFILRF